MPPANKRPDRSEVTSFDQSKLNHVPTTEKVILPSKEGKTSLHQNLNSHLLSFHNFYRHDREKLSSLIIFCDHVLELLWPPLFNKELLLKGENWCWSQLLRWFVTLDNSQQQFLAQHNIATLLQHCFKELQHCSNIATQCSVKNRLCKLSRSTSPLWLKFPFQGLCFWDFLVFEGN